MADAYARTGKTQEELAIYDSVLQELAAQAQKVPLGHGVAGGEDSPESFPGSQDASDGEMEGDSSATTTTCHAARVAMLPAQQSVRREPDGCPFARIPARAGTIPRASGSAKADSGALAVLRREIDRNPDDPGLYQRLAIFLARIAWDEEEEVYPPCMQRFPDRSWYHKLARFYLLHKKNAEFETLTDEVVKTFSGTGLERYFANVGYGGTPVLYLRLNQFATNAFRTIQSSCATCWGRTTILTHMTMQHGRPLSASTGLKKQTFATNSSNTCHAPDSWSRTWPRSGKAAGKREPVAGISPDKSCGRRVPGAGRIVAVAFLSKARCP